MITLLLMMGGNGTRFGANVPKQYIEVKGYPLFTYIIKAYCQKVQLDRIIVVSNKHWISDVEKHMQKMALEIPYKIVSGGTSRSESVLNGLAQAMEEGNSEDIVLIHDATHPYVDAKGTQKVIESVKNGTGATLGGVQCDTVYKTDERGNILEVLPRQQVLSGASPEAFRLGEIYAIYKKATKEELEKMTSAGAIALEHGILMKTVPSKLLNLKITFIEDMEIFEHLFDYYFG